MNDTAWQTGGPIIDGGPVWLTASFVLIGLGVLFALFILAWGTRLARRRQQARDQLEERGELHNAGDPKTPTAHPTAPLVAPAPPPIAETPVIAAPPPPAPEPAPEPAPLADEPIAAAAPLDASPASLAASEPEVAPAGTDDFTRMKGVGPKLAERLNALGVTSFAQIAALTPEQAAALDAELGTFQGRIHRDRWIEQAGFLARGDTAGYEAVFGKL
ncbi:helix-hairpin-helix domain-containing protein [Sphingomonas sp. 7/4-4]|uniref:helix-hairpin-helix domain-containing protein n=1 Tax=Sphingomonas sp. 7/4-4 TaxID=3018446 RepID=UPI0022F3D3A0|nr:helix-hairpin-helix domain-containing protein [Sphingomonas sp. 7/4-4]WBY07411.1 helix-hairpin-helix domain-containing protein [Sphingomonas sp. 7/4-4]